MEADKKKLFKVLDPTFKPAGKNFFYDKKKDAKRHRDKLIEKGLKGIKISLGPDHNNHPLKRRHHGWNKGLHPKKGHKGKSSPFLNQR